MKKLMKKIDNDIESMNLSLRNIAEKINVDYSVIRNGVKGKTAEMKFENFLKLVAEVYQVLLQSLSNHKSVYKLLL
ncbi:hypothetical protein COK81_15855 [Bacillus thuringiensis]|uniref:Uncharacterized protein n=1 Tax=Bacillus thuringiensis TaxID=1428 RepID=A0A9X7AZJ6_BACTU|nr:hypothetical protein [Bacillus thuringiensis]PFT90973.1 hypothetical protein COK81_15855 [Bacillus thuringiensis]